MPCEGLFESATAQERLGLVDHPQPLAGAAERGQRSATPQQGNNKLNVMIKLDTFVVEDGSEK